MKSIWQGRMNKSSSLRGIVLVFALLAFLPLLTANGQAIPITVDAHSATTPLPHFWEQMFGSGRAILSLRESYRKDLRSVKKVTDFRYVRFHAIFQDEVGLFDLDAQGKPVYNYSYVDQIYDGLLAEGVRPFVELSFMPKKLASDPASLHPFWYKQNVSPPKDYVLWDDMIQHFVSHLVDRYGIDEVSQWYFEVWNEPNIDFWRGKPAQATYFELYDHTARDVKGVSPRLRVGGPSTAQAAWVKDFLDHTQKNNVPVDFASTHVYANDLAQDVFGTMEVIPRDRMVCRSVRKVHQEIQASATPNLPLFFSEYNASYKNEPDVTDTTYMGPWLGNIISQCDGLAEMMSYWSFSDVFEEQGVTKTPFYGGFGLLAEDNIPKPVLNAFDLFHHLGDARIPLDSDSVIATKRKDGTIVLALWNYTAPYGVDAAYTPPPAVLPAAKTFAITLRGVPPNANVTLWRVDADHGNVVKEFDALGRPPFPSREQILQLQQRGKPAPAEKRTLHNGKLSIEVPPQGLVLLEVRSQ